MSNRDVLNHNQTTWDRKVTDSNEWTVPVSPQMIADARTGDWSVLLTPTKPVPRNWFPPLNGLRILGLASAGGQQCPVFAAAGAILTVYDLSTKQLEQDRMVAERENLAMDIVQGDMRDLSVFDDETFDLVFHPVANCFVPDILPVWREAYRVLKPGGILLAGFANPLLYMLPDEDLDGTDEPILTHPLPYSDDARLTAEQKADYLANGWSLEFGHTLTDQIAGQLNAGFVLTGFYEDVHHVESHPLNRFGHAFIATRAAKP